MRSKALRAGAALFMATAAFVPAHLAAASSNEDNSGYQCPGDQALFDQIKAWIVEFGPYLDDPSQADPSIQGQIELLAGLALLSDDELCLTLTGSGGGDNGDDGNGDDDHTSTTESETSSTTEHESSTSTSEPESTTSTSENSTTSTTSENTTTTVPEETTTTTARETTTTTAKATTTTTAAATTSTTAATTSTTGATTSTTGATTTDPTVGGVVVTSAGTLPRTGSDPAPLVAFASLITGLGVCLLALKRRFVS